MPYVDRATFQYYKSWRSITANGNVSLSEFNMLVEEFSAEINRFHDETEDICTVSDGTMESYLHAKYTSDLIDETLTFKELTLNIAPQDRTQMRAPSLFDDAHVGVRNALIREKREEKAKAITYSMQTGQIRRWY
jgi:hypothetical protein